MAFATGIWAGRALELAPAHVLTAALPAALLLIPAWLRRSRHALAAAALTLVALCGALNVTGRAARPPAEEVGRLLALAPGRPRLALVTGQVLASHPPARGSSPGQRLTLEVESLGPAGRAYPARGQVRLTLWGDSRDVLRPSERVRLPLLLSIPGARRSPGGLDYGEYLASRGTWTSGSGRAGLFKRLPGGGGSVRAALAGVRERLAGMVREEMPEREGALLNTILLGWRGEMEADEQLAFTRTGAGHLLAVSGIHVMLLVGAIWWLLRAIGVRPRPAALVLIVFALVYAQLAGARTPVVRAATMACLLLGGIALGRLTDGPSSLAAAALLILGLWPRELFSVGFQMSFAAVFFIMAIVPALERSWVARLSFPYSLTVEPRERRRARAFQWLRMSLLSSLAATAACMPLVVSIFGVLSPWAPLVNLFAIPIAGLALAAGLALLVIGTVIPPLAPVPAALAWGFLWLLEGIVDLAGHLPGSSLASDQPPGWVLLAYYALAAVLLWPRLLPERWRARAAVAVLVLAVPVSVSGLFRAPAPEGMRVSLLSLGRGRAAILEEPSGEKCAVWVEGSGRNVVDFLRAERLGGLDRTLLASGEKSAASGAEYLVSAGRAGRLAAPAGRLRSESLAELAHHADRLAPGWTAALGEVEVIALGADPGKRNIARPALLLARWKGRAVLFADLSNGPAVRAAADEMAKRNLRADLVVVGFAWRLKPGSERLLKLCGARLALVSLSAFESSEPAGQELLAMLRRAGIEPLSTHELGTLRATITERGIRLERYDGAAWRKLGGVRLPEKTLDASPTPP